MNRFSRIPNPFYPNVIKETKSIPKNPLGDYIVDTTYYVPNKEANKILAKQRAGQLLNDLMYDNPRDIANGSVNVYARQKGRDLAELTAQARQLNREIAQVYDDITQELTGNTPSPAPAPAPSPAPSPVPSQ